QGHEVASPELGLDLVAGREAARVLLEAERIGEVRDGEGSHHVARSRDVGAGVHGVDRQPVLQGISQAQLVTCHSRRVPHEEAAPAPRKANLPACPSARKRGAAGYWRVTSSMTPASASVP